MADIIDYLTSPRGLLLANAIASAVFVAFIWISITKQSISLGSIMPKIRKSENPRIYWSVIFLDGVIAAWTGVTVALHFFSTGLGFW